MNRSQRSALFHAVLSLLLSYPDQRVYAELETITAALPMFGAAERGPVAEFVAWLRERPSIEASENYVRTFDHTRRRSLHLTYYRYGDTRARGMALLTLKHRYRQAGYPIPEAELPDFLPLVLEFAAHAPEAGQGLLSHCRDGLELLGEALREMNSPYAPLIDALRAHLPALRSSERKRLRALALAGPPREEVGLEPFAPPEYLTGVAR
ncbi:nitrate reductase molybdenum cofactor assembly chaperone [Nocardia transvalensis]|uniref:nitrate reductase molybdenum cofactor assembly chaperone n=1 Tax=Nocardia transvalensis TaxID=37333 RepID=UPI001895F2DB|nr:nitrate reductase molybdenum cofactor assembly chaperone [Nocardia transvalensis]MBF6334134.1 nitrate reductase molybdenum cofactor assembly chaperone [Nocardia transvalensis]